MWLREGCEICVGEVRDDDARAREGFGEFGAEAAAGGFWTSTSTAILQPSFNIVANFSLKR